MLTPSPRQIRQQLRDQKRSSSSISLDVGLDSRPDYQTVRAGKVVPLFSDRRIMQGLHKTGSGVLLSSDVNGAASTPRKEISEHRLISQIEADKDTMDIHVTVKHIDQPGEAGPGPRETMSGREAV